MKRRAGSDRPARAGAGRKIRSLDTVYFYTFWGVSRSPAMMSRWKKTGGQLPDGRPGRLQNVKPVDVGDAAEPGILVADEAVGLYLYAFNGGLQSELFA